MKRAAMPVVFASGLAVLAWVAWGFIGTSALALVMTLLIAAVYLYGANELRVAQQHTRALAAASADTGLAATDLEAWLARLPDSLRSAVRRCIEGEPLTLPGPVFTPYLAGLLVLLGMLGTFLGMVSTFRGAMLALEGAASVELLRAALMAPLVGLGLAFGTSVAGVAASAALGLLSVMVRRERIAVVRTVQACAHGLSHLYSQPRRLAQRRDDQLERLLAAVQAQGDGMPRLVEQLSQLVQGLERKQDQWQLAMQLQQSLFHEQAGAVHRELSRSVGESLQSCLIAGARAAGDSLRPVFEDALAAAADQSRQTHEAVLAATDKQLRALASQWADITSQHAEHVRQQASELVAAVRDSAVEADAARAAAEQQRLHAWLQGLHDLRDQEAVHVRAALERIDALGEATSRHLEASTRAFHAPLNEAQHQAARLVGTVTELVTALQQHTDQLKARDTREQQQRTQSVQQLDAALHTLQEAALRQAGQLDLLVASVSGALAQSTQRFDDVVERQSQRLNESAAELAAGAVDLAAMGDAFAAGVTAFGQHQAALGDAFAQVLKALEQVSARSDEQLAYYLAQAREVVDLSIAAQHGIVEDLRRLHAQSEAAMATP